MGHISFFQEVSLLRSAALLGGALAGKQIIFYCVVPNPVAGENCLHLSIFNHF
jgi:hypothetical protein